MSERQRSTVAILAGIDEAGFGPLLGPLVVSCSALRVDPGLLEADLWQVLNRSVGQTRKHLAGRLLVTDSKKAYRGPQREMMRWGAPSRAAGLGHLERTVLAALQALGVGTQDLASLLSALSPDCVPRLSDYPWFQNLQSCRLPVPEGRPRSAGPLPRSAAVRRGGRASGEAADLKIAAQVLADDLQAHGAGLVALRSSCLDVAYYNTMVDRVKNKAQVLFIAVTQLIQGLLDGFPEDEIRILVDRQGGRSHYRANLLRSFPEMDLRIVAEGERVSTYEMRGAGRLVRLSFEVNADGLYLPVALASMVSKYVRELLMKCMNDYFVGLDAGLTPTAGYWKDGTRFLDQLHERLPQLKIDAHRLIRCR